ncbi:SusC/RagA family TonB-linked outer membrane protein [Catalinimonas niigatensis]|nr:SusC/RagA family TonB-linked outer membrane protein [Catalinimonas niigatensis]WPP53723.1 SusC/RagA family TonB-linked outer membrane protein [Catalinimonas niigatensis]
MTAEIEEQMVEKTITGKVTDSDNQEPLPGVNVLVQNTTIGTVTDIDGNYTITAPDDAQVLVFSSVGYTTEEVEIGGRSVINMEMLLDIQSLSEVVVTALGIKKEAKKLGYATSTVAPDQITVNRTTNFMNALQGKVPGVNITSLGTGPAGTSKIRIRGQSSFGGQNQPLVVVNGVPIDNTNFGATTGQSGSDAANTDRGRNRTSDGGDGLTSINPDDIESMTVLRGAAASALYGARAKDGVIMITTKQRGEGKGIGVQFNSNFTVDTPLDFTDYQYEYGQGENGLRPTDPNPTSGVWSFGERFEPGMTQILFDGIEVPYVPQPSHVSEFYRTGNTFSNTITLSSGGEYGGFNLSLSNTDNESIVPNSDYNRKTVNLGFTQSIAKRLNVSGNVNYSNEDYKNPPQIAEQDMSTPTTIYSLANSMPLDLLRENMADANGNEFVYSRFRNRTNPYWAAYERFDNVNRDRLFGNLTARYNFTDWLYLQGRVGQDYYARDQEYNFPTGTASLGNAQEGFVNGQFVQDTRRFREINTDFLIGANRTFGVIGVDLTVGGNRMYRRMDRNNVVVDDFVVRDLYTVMNGRVKDPIYEISERQVNSLYGMVDLSYKEFLYLNATARNDWFSTLSPENRSILYPSVTGSFVFSQTFENFPNWINFGKIRAGYAEVGSDTDVQPYASNLFYSVNNNLFPNPNGQLQPVGVINASTVPNADLRPMRVSEKEIGLELKLMDNRVGLDITYYDKLTTDQILAAQVSDASGYTNQLINVGESVNRGVEMLLTFTPVRTTNFNWDLSFNGSYNNSEVLKLGVNPEDTIITVGTGQFDGELRQVVGEPLGQLYGFGYLRDDQGRQVFDAGSGRPLRTPLQIGYGTAIPRWVGGITNSLNYKGINLSFLIDFKLGHKLISGTNFNAWRHGLHKGTLVGREENVVVGDGVNPSGEINETESPLQAYYETVRSLRIQEEFVYNAGFWKLRQITLGYDFSRHLPDNLFIEGLKLSFVANNVAILKKWTDNIDPEQFGFSTDNLIGLEAPGLPTTRSMGFNLNVKF